MPNRLATETSPYLLQHADNPVDWYPWCDEAFAEASATDKPVLLSVGYSSCHWCHVMAHESFEDPETAALMNELFVNIKVDREQRPDVDATYMVAVQATTGRGGWPMTVFLTPDRRPFFAGTYFPATGRSGLPSFRTVLTAVRDAWDNRRDELVVTAERIKDLIGRQAPVEAALPGSDLLIDAYQRIAEHFDEAHGGFGSSPKFPQEPVLEFLLRIADEPWAENARPMLRTTLQRMASGGLRDHVGGGFARYSVDRSWTIPHFEKMLYTNAQLARLYLRAGQVLEEPSFTDVAIDTIAYLLRDLRLPGGAFASAEDADSEGREGAFYVWDRHEFEDAVGPDLAPLALATFGVGDSGNFEGFTHLQIADPGAAEELGLDALAARAMLGEARRRLFERRSARQRPGLDDKVVAAWNGLAVRALAEAGAVTDDGRLLDAAGSAAKFILDDMVVSGRLRRAWRQGRATVPGFADDYAGMAVGCFSLYQATGEIEWYRDAMWMVEQLIELFLDPNGGFFTTGADVEAPLARTRDHFDSPSPSANSLAAEALMTASLYTGRQDLRAHVDGAIRAGVPTARLSPTASGYLLAVLHTVLTGPLEVAITGPDADALARVIWERFRPGIVPAVDRTGSSAGVVPLLEGRWSETTRAFVCKDFVCDLPLENATDLRERLR